MNKTEKLLPCPFCGQQPTEYAIEPHTHALQFSGGKMPDHQGSHVIECACGCGIIDATREEVFSVWNRRPTPCLHQIQEPAPVLAAPAAVAVPDAVRDALLQSEAALEVATARILKADPDHSISVTSEAKALVAVRAALAATPAAAESDVWPCVNIDVDDAGNVTSAKLYSPGLPAGNHDVYPVRVPYMDEHTEAWKACHSELCKLAPDFMRDSKLNGMDSAVAAIRHLATTPAAAAPVLPEPDKQVKELMVLIGKYGSAVEANSTGNPSNYTLASDESAAYEAIKAKLRALLATGGQAQADARDAERWRAATRNMEINDVAVVIYDQLGDDRTVTGDEADAAIDAAIAAAKGE